MPDPLVLRDPAQFKALGHPLRHRLLTVLRQRPATLAQLATALGSTKGTVGYHVNVLTDAGLLEVATTRQVRGGTERYYRLVSQNLRLARDAPVGAEFLVKAALDEMLPATQDSPEQTLLRHVRLTPERVSALAAELERFADPDHLPDGPEGEPYGLLVSLFRANVPLLPPES
ncbi:ArsR/SmtB family transcription factor [Fodinicola feengrottensis]|uniref:HTH arsR-type domain-containing protein n=1 Tax=Fodinicola feengrottensis TaxID=435914 RepID=A0ABN2ICR8_9ACTN|nr:winged helix-turn-helix domain-containing protein [Fodinicola feengrottensis]